MYWSVRPKGEVMSNENKLPEFGPTAAYLYKTKGTTMTHWSPVMNEETAQRAAADLRKAADACEAGARIALKINNNKKTEKSPDAFVIVQTAAEVQKMKNTQKNNETVGF